MITGTLCGRRAALAGLVAWGTMALGCSGALDEGSSETVAHTSAALTEYGPNQAAAENFYAHNNVVNIKIEMSDSEWLTLKTEQPTPQGCVRVPVDSNGESPDRFPWQPTTRVTVSGSNYLTTPVPFTGVEIKKKSFCGSLTTGANEKPSIKLKFASSSARDAMGLQYIDLNNSRQDDSYVRQTLGYYLYGLAGVPHPRANYAKVQVVTPSATENLVYVNVEPLRGSFINNPANKFSNRTITQSGSSDARVPGNLYEFTIGDDFNTDMLTYVGPEKVSAIQGPTKPDLRYAVSRLNADRSAATFQDLFNADQFATFWAMEVLLKHWDGYTVGRNNTYVYNDVVATSGTQSPATVDFKFIPWGIDQILQKSRTFTVVNPSVAGSAMYGSELHKRFMNAVASLKSTVFSRAMLDGAIKTRIDTLQSQLQTLGIDASAQIKVIRTQLKLSRAAAVRLTGMDESGIYLADLETGNVIHASTTEQVPNSPGHYEIYHRPSANEASDRWLTGWSPTGLTLTSEAFNRNLIGSPSLLTSAGHPYIFQAPPGTNQPYDAWNLDYEGTTSDFPGTILLQNVATGGYAHFSVSGDTTPQGRLRVYQGGANHLIMY
ncbi:MAG TPA: CotH kinase family protein [Polyangiaceae bacterium]|nr:CotH kinase family protein [Polyangiaceae bacterium]